MPLPIDPAHLKQPDGTWHRGPGGDRSKDMKATKRDFVLALCRHHHTEYDGGVIDIRPQDDTTGAAGCLDFYRKRESGRLELTASEKAMGVSETRGR